MTKHQPFGVSDYRACEPIGKCIYCGSTDPPLTNEHILPQGLGTREFLPAASCERCRAIIQQIETRVLAGPMMKPLRKMFGMRGQKKRKVETNLFPVEVAAPEGRFETEFRPLEQILLSGALPAFPVADPSKRADDASPYDITLHVYGKLNATELLTEAGFSRVRIKIEIDLFARMLAKIAHCMAVAGSNGVDRFESYLPPIILGTDANWRRFVGGYYGEPRREEVAHHCGFR